MGSVRIGMAVMVGMAILWSLAVLDGRFLPARQGAEPASSIEATGRSGAIPGVTAAWWAEVEKNIELAEYEVSAQGAGLEATNRANEFRSRYEAAGIAVFPRLSGGEHPWRFSLCTSRWGRRGSMQAVEPAVAPAVAGSRVTYPRPGLVEWYENRKEGIEQGFTVTARPPGSGPLIIQQAITSTLEPALAPDRQRVDWLDAGGACVIRYADLHVVDAGGREVESWLSAHGDELEIWIQDAGASYPLLVDPLFNAPAWTAQANQAGAQFGVSVSTAGDVNGDGFSDVIVGAHSFDNGQTNEGRAFVFHGSAHGLTTLPVWTAESDQANAFFGLPVAAAGDVNGDGFSDVVVGAYAYNNRGRVYVYHGSASGLVLSPARTFDSDQTSSFFGRAAGAAGDVNGDGFADVIIGAPGYDNGEVDEGRAFVYYGSSTGLGAAPVWTVESNQPGASFGTVAAAAGDVNGDGFADVIVGAPSYDNDQANEGRVFAYSGSASGLTTAPVWIAESNQSLSNFGGSGGTAGDVNGDGYADLVIGASMYTNNETNEGRAFLYQGSAQGLGPTPVWTTEPNQASAQHGFSAATAGDVNGDGYADVIVGAPFLSNGQTAEGRAVVYQGSASGLSVAPVWNVESNQMTGRLGISVATAGDVDGDGFSDVIAGADFAGNGGQAFVYGGFAAGTAFTPGWTAESNQAGGYFHVVASAGDVNGDGYSDVIVGAQGYDNGEQDEGRAYVFHGSAAGLSAVPAWTAEPNRASALFGFKVQSAGDVNGDGFSDIMISAVMFPPAGKVEGIPGDGQVFVYHGSAAGLGAAPAWTAEADQGESTFGAGIAAGDVNGDGFSDVIIAAPLYDNGENGEGRVYLYEGSPVGLQTLASWKAESDLAGATLGFAVATGDENGDGYSDIIAGIPWYSNGQNNEGGAFAYYGSPLGPPRVPSVVIESDVAGALLGLSVAAAGDVNGDGFSDVLIGSPSFSNGESGEGKAFLYQGSGGGLSTVPAWEAESNQASALFAHSMGSAGDVNGDGFSDVIISAYIYDNGEQDEGVAYIYMGGSAGLSTTYAWFTQSNQANGQYGRSVATAGDVNGDGFADVLVGAATYDNGQGDEGRVFLYYGNDADGLDRIPRQARADDTAPIDLLGRANSLSSFRVKALGRTAAGRGRVRLAVEVEPLGVPFDGGGLLRGSMLLTGAPAAGGSAIPLSVVASGLDSDTPYHWRLRILSNSPFFPNSPWFSMPLNAPAETDLRTPATIGVAEPSAAPPSDFRLRPGDPNPFRTATELAYTLPRAGRLKLAVYDVLGRQVAELADQVLPAGRYTARWDGRDAGGRRLASGIYFVRIEFAGRAAAQKVLLAR